MTSKGSGLLAALFDIRAIKTAIARLPALQLHHDIGHHSFGLILLSRIDGDAPRAQIG